MHRHKRARQASDLSEDTPHAHLYMRNALAETVADYASDSDSDSDSRNHDDKEQSRRKHRQYHPQPSRHKRSGPRPDANPDPDLEEQPDSRLNQVRVDGFPCNFIRDPFKYSQQSKLLIPWPSSSNSSSSSSGSNSSGQSAQSVLVDRFDARLLLSELDPHAGTGADAQSPSAESSRAQELELDRMRFGTMERLIETQRRVESRRVDGEATEGVAPIVDWFEERAEPDASESKADSEERERELLEEEDAKRRRTAHAQISFEYSTQAEQAPAESDADDGRSVVTAGEHSDASEPEDGQGAAAETGDAVEGWDSERPFVLALYVDLPTAATPPLPPPLPSSGLSSEDASSPSTRADSGSASGGDEGDTKRAQAQEPTTTTTTATTTATAAVETTPTTEDAFQPPPWLLPLPESIAIPKSLKQHEIIERTAKFVKKQGLQLEIVVKAKQQGNPSFAFLDFMDTLNPYYKHALASLKEERPASESGPAPSISTPSISTPAPKPRAKAPAHVSLAPSVFLAPSVSLAPAVPSANAPQLAPVPTPAYPYGYYTSSSAYYAPHALAPAMAAPHASVGPAEATLPSVSPEMQEIIAKTAPFVAKNGTDFEATLLDKNGSDPRFSFLNPWDPNHLYYKGEVDAARRKLGGR